MYLELIAFRFALSREATKFAAEFAAYGAAYGAGDPGEPDRKDLRRGCR